MFYKEIPKGCTALITRGATGIGLEIATANSQLGAAMMIVGRNEERVQQAAEALRRDGGQVASSQCDAGNYDEVQAVVEATVAQFSSLDILGGWQFHLSQCSADTQRL